MLEAVQVIHDEKIVHSDLKPANFVLVKGSLKLIDFGIAKAIPNDTTNISRDQQIGTANYMSPEAIEDTNLMPGRRCMKVCAVCGHRKACLTNCILSAFSLVVQAMCGHWVASCTRYADGPNPTIS